MENSLSRRLGLELWRENIIGICLGPSIKSLNNAQFVDDTLLFGGDLVVSASRFLLVLNKVIKVYRANINKGKIQI